MVLDVTDVFRMCSERQKEGRRVINAHIGTPSHSPPASVKDLLARIGEVGCSYLPFEGTIEARERISSFARRFLNRDLEPERIFVTNGGAQALTSVLMVLRRRKMLLPAPGFTQYFDNARIMGLDFRTYDPTAEDIVSEVLSKLGDASVVLINYPNNPTGCVQSNDAMEELWEELRRRNVLLVNDAAYSQIYFEAKPRVPGDVIIDTFSKTLALPGLRLGYAYWGLGDERSIFDAVYITSAGVSEVSQLLLSMLLDALSEDYLEGVRSHYRRKRDTLIRLMREHGFSFPEPRGAFYVFTTHPLIKDSGELAERLLRREPAIGIVPGNVFMGSARYFRICYSLLGESEAEEMVNIISDELKAR
ncbi:MAG: pyridoxal phosphate-dependent aminotransferase [Candidatus Korarchaeum sp.]|nr:pyridoxal phosphate-dependent aminotransferase [Candidatus Korarchaeum sp.]MDW8035289.1 pyridoxal phosphate-dependent aminotransferase [Candidatus Korarchaeum sp.]